MLAKASKTPHFGGTSPAQLSSWHPGFSVVVHHARPRSCNGSRVPLSHPNTVTIFDYGRTPDGLFYYAMELLDGVSLDELVALDGAQPAGRVVSLLRQAAGALPEAHGVDLIHRDIKPGNIMLCERGGAPDVVKVVGKGDRGDR